MQNYYSAITTITTIAAVASTATVPTSTSETRPAAAIEQARFGSTALQSFSSGATSRVGNPRNTLLVRRAFLHHPRVAVPRFFATTSSGAPFIAASDAYVCRRPRNEIGGLITTTATPTFRAPRSRTSEGVDRGEGDKWSPCRLRVLF